MLGQFLHKDEWFSLNIICLTVSIIRHTINASVLLRRSPALLYLVTPGTQGAYFLAPTFLVSVIEPAALKASLRYKVVVNIADKLSYLQFCV
jgi:hypothetical protein